MILPIYIYGQPVLRKVAEDITPDYPKLKELINNMYETLDSSNGIGLAAPQITYLVHDLKEKGVRIDGDITTVNEARQAILAQWTVASGAGGSKLTESSRDKDV